MLETIHSTTVIGLTRDGRTVIGSDGQVTVGAAVMNSADVVLAGNTFEGSRSAATGVGLIFKDADRLTIRENRIVGNRVGLEFDNAPATPDGWVRLHGNLIAFNDVGFSLMSTAAITATENALVENLRAVQSRGLVRADANRWTVAGRITVPVPAGSLPTMPTGRQWRKLKP